MGDVRSNCPNPHVSVEAPDAMSYIKACTETPKKVQSKWLIKYHRKGSSANTTIKMLETSPTMYHLHNQSARAVIGFLVVSVTLTLCIQVSMYRTLDSVKSKALRAFNARSDIKTLSTTDPESQISSPSWTPYPEYQFPLAT